MYKVTQYKPHKNVLQCLVKIPKKKKRLKSMKEPFPAGYKAGSENDLVQCSWKIQRFNIQHELVDPHLRQKPKLTVFVVSCSYFEKKNKKQKYDCSFSKNKLKMPFSSWSLHIVWSAVDRIVHLAGQAKKNISFDREQIKLREGEILIDLPPRETQYPVRQPGNQKSTDSCVTHDHWDSYSSSASTTEAV